MNYITSKNYSKVPSFMSIPRALLNNDYYLDRLDAVDLIIYAYLLDKVRTSAFYGVVTTDGTAYIQDFNSSIASKLRINSTKVSTSLKKLEEVKLVEVLKGRRLPNNKTEKNIYFVGYPEDAV